MLAQLVEADDEDPALYAPSSIVYAPGVQFTRETWWDALLAVYVAADAVSPAASRSGDVSLTVVLRDATQQRIAADVRFLFHVSLHWFSFINIPRFFAQVFDPVARRAIQPSLILAALGLSTYFQSSELERGSKGRALAMQLMDQARALFDASLTSGWVDVQLVQAAWVRTPFPLL